MNTQEHNGWTNYPTWRINLECFDGISWVRDDVWGETIGDFAEQLQGDIETRLDEECCEKNRTSLANSYAHAFISNVNWHEIAKSINEDYKLGLKPY